MDSVYIFYKILSFNAYSLVPHMYIYIYIMYFTVAMKKEQEKSIRERVLSKLIKHNKVFTSRLTKSSEYTIQAKGRHT